MHRLEKVNLAWKISTQKIFPLVSEKGQTSLTAKGAIASHANHCMCVYRAIKHRQIALCLSFLFLMGVMICRYFSPDAELLGAASYRNVCSLVTGWDCCLTEDSL